MEQDKNEINGLYMKRISLYEDLLSCIKRESDNLINQNIKGIWSSLEEKKEILEAIEENNKYFPKNTVANSDLPDIPQKEREIITQFKRKLKGLKHEIGTRIKENISFINDTLGFITDLFSLFSNSDKKLGTYGPKLKNRNEQTNLIYNNEV